MTTYTCICGKTYNHSSNICVHRKKCQQYQSQKNQKENISITIQEKETNESKEEILALENEILKLKNEQLELKLKHQNEIIELLNKIQVAQPIQQPIQQETSVEHFHLQNYLQNCNVKSFNFIKDFIKSTIKEKDLLSACNFHNKQSEVDKLYISKIKNGLNTKIDDKFCYELTPIRVSDLKRKVIYFKENDEWNKINFEEYVEKIHLLYCGVQNKIGLMNLNLKNENSVDNEHYMLDNIKLSSVKITETNMCEVNTEHIANQLLDMFKIDK
jgi:hypothetical protein